VRFLVRKSHSAITITSSAAHTVATALWKKKKYGVPAR